MVISQWLVVYTSFEADVVEHFWPPWFFAIVDSEGGRSPFAIPVKGKAGRSRQRLVESINGALLLTTLDDLLSLSESLVVLLLYYCWVALIPDWLIIEVLIYGTYCRCLRYLALSRCLDPRLKMT